MSPLLILLPSLLATLLVLPVPLLHKIHAITIVPGCTLCNVPEIEQFDLYQTAVVILGFYLPSAIIFFLLICLSIRRCYTCSADKCVSSYCKEEMTICFLSIPFIIVYQILLFPHLNHFLFRLSLPPLDIETSLPPHLSRGLEALLGLIFPLIVYSCMPAYTKFSSAPDDSDVKNEVHRASRTPSRRISIDSKFA